LFGDAGSDAADASVRSFGAARGMTDEQIEQLASQVRTTVVKAAEALHLDSHEIGEVTDLLLHHLVEVRSGRFTPEKLRAWDAATFADHKAQSGMGGKRAVWDLFKRVDAWLKTTHPALYAKLEGSSGFAHHPRVLRHIVRAYRADQDTGARAARAGSRFRGARTVLPDAGSAGDIGDG
jgi:hypothetical protein